MDAQQFDALARTLSGQLSRRVAARGIVGALAGLLGAGKVLEQRLASAQAATPTPLPVCTDPARPGVGCACTTGTQNPCGDTMLLCCKNHPDGPPGSPGACTPASVGCDPLGPPSTCTSLGCRCNGGTESECGDGLICCPDNSNMPGGPGRCVQEEHCNVGDCTARGCTCHSGTQGACDGRMVCCAHDSSVAGGAGRCEAEHVCFAHQCQATTNPCPSVCSKSAFCRDCCSGYCGAEGHCAAPTCEGIGCPCRGGVEGDCSPGLVCCQSQMTAPNEPGGPGMCAAPEGCGNEAAATPEATPAN